MRDVSPMQYGKEDNMGKDKENEFRKELISLMNKYTIKDLNNFIKDFFDVQTIQMDRQQEVEYKQEKNVGIRFRNENNLYYICFIEDGGIAITKTFIARPGNYGDKFIIRPIATNHIVIY